MVKITVISLTGFTAAMRRQKITVVSREDTLLILGNWGSGIFSGTLEEGS